MLLHVIACPFPAIMRSPTQHASRNLSPPSLLSKPPAVNIHSGVMLWGSNWLGTMCAASPKRYLLNYCLLFAQSPPKLHRSPLTDCTMMNFTIFFLHLQDCCLISLPFALQYRLSGQIFTHQSMKFCEVAATVGRYIHSECRKRELPPAGSCQRAC